MEFFNKIVTIGATRGGSHGTIFYQNIQSFKEKTVFQFECISYKINLKMYYNETWVSPDGKRTGEIKRIVKGLRTTIKLKQY